MNRPFTKVAHLLGVKGSWPFAGGSKILGVPHKSAESVDMAKAGKYATGMTEAVLDALEIMTEKQIEKFKEKRSRK